MMKMVIIEIFINLRFVHEKLNETYDAGWMNTSIPSEVSDRIRPLHQQAHMFYGLQPASNYSVRLQARNQYGPGEWTDEFVFQTAAGMYFHRES